MQGTGAFSRWARHTASPENGSRVPTRTAIVGRNSLAVALIVLPVLAAIYYVISFGVNVPFMDEWDYVGREMDLRDLFAQHNEHRIPVTRALLLLLDYASGSDSRVPMFVTLAALTGVLAILYQEYRGTRTPLMLFVPVPWLLFTLRQNENYLWGAQLTIALCALFAVASFRLLRHCESNWPRLAGAVACAVGASLTFANGLLVWPVGLLQLVVQHKRGRHFATVAWSSAAVLTMVLYLKGYQKPAQHPPILAFLSNPAIAAEYFFASLGGAFATAALGPTLHDKYLWQGIAKGAVFLIISTAILWGHFRGGSPERSPTLGPFLLIFALATSLLLTLGRSGIGLPGQALSSRYVTLTILGPVGAWLMATEQRHSVRGVALCACLLTLGCIGAIVTTREALSEGPAVRDARQNLQYCLLTYEDQPDEALLGLILSAARVRTVARVLQERRQSVFRGALREPNRRLDEPTAYSLDTINNQAVPSTRVVRIDSKGHLLVTGWAVDSRARGTALGVWLSLDGRHGIPTRYGVARPDVANNLHSKSYESSGFSGIIAATSIGSGCHQLTLKIATADGKAFYESAPPIIVEVQ
jgi:hypothetical protein